jgi:exopolysaccharide biosynthesis WecB/TagA/CpsF family protein
VTALTYQFDDFDLKRFLDVAAGFGQGRYGYVVTPNTDHMIRLHDEAPFRASYADASYVLLDSRVLAYFLRLTRGLRLPVCAGSDLTAELFARIVGPDDPLVLIGGSGQQAQILAERYGLKRLAHFNPPMGFVRDPEQVEICLRFIEAHSPFRFCFLGVGAPQQEMLAQRLRERGLARGLALCIGASIDFLTGAERRAPRWMQVLAIEWVFRLLNNPGRLARRYLVRGPRIFGVLRKAQVVLRPADVMAPATSTSVRKTGTSA